MNHTFVIRNDGDEPLKLEKGATTCKCTLSDLKTGDVPPGGTAEVRLDWKLITLGEQFRQTAEIHTNDPRRPTVSLTVHGTVTDLVRLEPRDLVLSNVTANDGARATVHLYGFKVKDLQVLSHEFTNQSTASYFSLDWKPTAADELREEAGSDHRPDGHVDGKTRLAFGADKPDNSVEDECRRSGQAGIGDQRFRRQRHLDRRSQPVRRETQRLDVRRHRARPGGESDLADSGQRASPPGREADGARGRSRQTC